MKPRRKEVVVKVVYWDCGNEDHRHRDKEVAKRCMDRTAYRAKRKRPPVEETRERHIRAARAVVNGETFKAAGAKIGVTAETVRQILYKVLRIADALERRRSGRLCTHAPGIWQIRSSKECWLEEINRVAEYWGVR